MRRHHKRLAGPSEDALPPGGEAVPLILVADDPAAAAVLAAVAASRYRCLAISHDEPDVLVLTGCPTVDVIDERRSNHPASLIAVWDRGRTASPGTISAALAAGAAFVNHPAPEVLLANIEAVQRRTVPAVNDERRSGP